MRRFRIGVAVLLACMVLSQRTSAQSLSLGLFERYVDALRQELAIPGLSAAIVQDGNIIWDSGFGFRDVAAASAATATTPYPIADLSETLGSTLLLQQCLDRGGLELTDRVERWTSFPDTTATVVQLLAHVQPSGIYHFDPARFAALTSVVEECVKLPFARILSDQILDRLAMIDSVPGRNVIEAPNAQLFPPAQIARYTASLSRMAVPYRVDGKGVPIRSDYLTRTIDASTGLISTVRDLARFDTALNTGVLLAPESLTAAWTRGAGRPTGLGWFVQTYNGERLVWQFGLAQNAYSSLILKVPGRRLTLILLANSDGLSSSFTPATGDVTGSIFAKLFLKLFVS